MSSLFRSGEFRLEAVGDRVWAAIAVPGAGAGSNCGIVDLGNKTLVFDTARTPQAARDLRSAAKMCTGRDPSIVVNSHWHLRHTTGNGVFRGSVILGTRTTRQVLEERGPGFEAMVADPTWELGTQELSARGAPSDGPLAAEELASEIAARGDLRRGFPGTGILAPNEVFEGRYRFPGSRDVQVVEGQGHSESDSVLWVGDAEVLFAGDLISVRTHPTLHLASLDRWKTTLDRIDSIGAKVVVPGHGPVGDPTAVDELRQYFATLESLAPAPETPPVPEPFARWTSPSRFGANLQQIRGAAPSDGAPG
jgi:cyclase